MLLAINAGFRLMLAPVAAAVVIDKNEYRLVPAYGSYDAK